MLGPSYQYSAQMIRVIDGDTYEVTVDLGFHIYHTIHVRLHAFDTSELRSSDATQVMHAQAARDFVSKLVPAYSMLVLLTAKAAIYNRWEAVVMYVDATGKQVSLADTLKAGGFAKLT